MSICSHAQVLHITFKMLLNFEQCIVSLKYCNDISLLGEWSDHPDQRDGSSDLLPGCLHPAWGSSYLCRPHWDGQVSHHQQPSPRLAQGPVSCKGILEQLRIVGDNDDDEEEEEEEDVGGGDDDNDDDIVQWFSNSGPPSLSIRPARLCCLFLFLIICMWQYETFLNLITFCVIKKVSNKL